MYSKDWIFAVLLLGHACIQVGLEHTLTPEVAWTLKREISDVQTHTHENYLVD
jgi:hypothetical protein